MAFKVVATPFGRRAETDYPYEHEALRAARHHHRDGRRPAADDEYLAELKDADAVIAGGALAERRHHQPARHAARSSPTAASAWTASTSTPPPRRASSSRNVPDVFIEEVAVHAMMLLLAWPRRRSCSTVPSARAAGARRASYMHPMPRVVGDTLGLVAFGNIPRLVAKKAKGFDMNVIAWDPFVAGRGVRAGTASSA